MRPCTNPWCIDPLHQWQRNPLSQLRDGQPGTAATLKAARQVIGQPAHRKGWRLLVGGDPRP